MKHIYDRLTGKHMTLHISLHYRGYWNTIWWT